MNKHKIRYYVLSVLVAFVFLGIGTSPFIVAGASNSTQASSSHGLITTTLPGGRVVLSNSMNSGSSPDGTLKVLASGQSDAQPMVLSGGYVYWYNYGNGQLNRVKETGGAVDTITTFSTSDGISFGIAVQGAYVYTSFDNYTYGLTAILKTKISNGATTTIESSTVYVNYGVTTSSKYVFFVQTNGDIERMSFTGSGLTTIATDPSTLPWQVLYSSSYVYWYDLCTGQIGKVSQNGGKTTLLSPALADCGTAVSTGIEPFTIVGTHVYWTFNFVNSADVYNNSVDAVSTSGTGFKILYSTTSSFFGGVASYKTSVLFSNEATSDMYSVPNTGGTPKLLYSGYTFLALGVVGKNVYATAETDVVTGKA